MVQVFQLVILSVQRIRKKSELLSTVAFETNMQMLAMCAAAWWTFLVDRGAFWSFLGQFKELEFCVAKLEFQDFLTL
jgi:hypothetical protein